MLPEEDRELLDGVVDLPVEGDRSIGVLDPSRWHAGHAFSQPRLCEASVTQTLHPQAVVQLGEHPLDVQHGDVLRIGRIPRAPIEDENRIVMPAEDDQLAEGVNLTSKSRGVHGEHRTDRTARHEATYLVEAASQFSGAATAAHILIDDYMSAN